MEKSEGPYSLSQEDMNSASNILADIAEFELGGVCLYAYMTEQICGIKGEAIRCLFRHARDESLAHYSKATTYLMRWRGGRNFVNPQPSQSPGLATLKQDSSPDNSEMFLSAAIVHEQHAIEFYKKLYYAVKGKDCALENWAIEMIQVETEDLVEFQNPLGLV